MNILFGLFCLIFMCSVILFFASIALKQHEKRIEEMKKWK